jgi:hypothetical protein
VVPLKSLSIFWESMYPIFISAARTAGAESESRVRRASRRVQWEADMSDLSSTGTGKGGGIGQI